MSLHVLDPGLHTLVVDQGRPHSRSLGVPISGAADRAALVLGNALVGNPPDAAALEITLAGPTLQAECDLACSLFGAPFEIAGDPPALRVGMSFMLAAGETLRIGTARRGVRVYLCVRCGIQTPMILGSRSGLELVIAGTVLPCSPARCRRRFVATNTQAPDMGLPGWFRCDPSPIQTVRVLPGAQATWVDEAAFYDQTYTVTPANNRMGLRLSGEPVQRHRHDEMVSEPVCPGTVQVPHGGQPIILGVDAQTIGGYPKVAQVIGADLDKLGQLRPGDAIRFARVELAEAEQLYRQREEELANWVIRLRASA